MFVRFVLVGPNFDMGSPLFFSVFEGRLLIQDNKGFWGWLSYSTFTVPYLAIDSPLYFPLCFPQVSFLDWSGMLLGGTGPPMLDSILGMDYPLFPWFCFDLVGLYSSGLTEGC